VGFACFHPEEAYASSYIIFAVLNLFISFGKDFGYVSFREDVGFSVVCGLDVLEKRFGSRLCKHPKTRLPCKNIKQ